VRTNRNNVDGRELDCATQRSASRMALRAIVAIEEGSRGSHPGSDGVRVAVLFSGKQRRLIPDSATPSMLNIAQTQGCESGARQEAERNGRSIYVPLASDAEKKERLVQEPHAAKSMMEHRVSAVDDRGVRSWAGRTCSEVMCEKNLNPTGYSGNRNVCSAG
jgi:hypothetical protein